MVKLTYLPRGETRRASATCAFCAQEIYQGERAWRLGTLAVCEDCFPQFARLALRSLEFTAGKETLP